MVNTTQWKYGKQWVYSTTYDEVVTSTVQNGLPIHEQFGVPGPHNSSCGTDGRTPRRAGQRLRCYV